MYNNSNEILFGDTLFSGFCPVAIPEDCDLLPRLKPWVSCFYGCWRSLHRLEFPSARRYCVLHAQPSDFTDAGTHGAICDPTTFTYVCQRTVDYLQSPDKFWFAPIPPLKDVGFPAHDVKGIHINFSFIMPYHGRTGTCV